MRAHRSAPLRRARLFVARRPLVYWLLVVLLAATTAGVVLDRTAAATTARRRWGDERTVLVAARDLAAGDRLGPGDVRPQRWPVALVPAGALEVLEPDTVVAAPIVAGEPLVLHRLGRPGAGPVAAALAPGTRGVAVPQSGPPLPVRPGDRVDVVAAGLGAPGDVVAAGALVMAAGEQALVIAVDVAELPGVAAALAGGAVVLAISADPPVP